MRSSAGFDAVTWRRAWGPAPRITRMRTKGSINYCASGPEPGRATPVNPQISDRITNWHGAPCRESCTRRCPPGGRKPANPLVDNLLTEPRPSRDDNPIEKSR